MLPYRDPPSCKIVSTGQDTSTLPYFADIIFEKKVNCLSFNVYLFQLSTFENMIQFI